MNDPENNKTTNVEDTFFTGTSPENGDDIDEELVALAPPPPGLQQAVVTGVIMAFSIVILVLFFPELRFFIQSFGEATPLGESSNVDLAKVDPEAYVSLTGIPLANRTITFSDGAQLFSSDIYRKMAPMSGKPELLVQWRTDNPDVAKKSSDGLIFPSAFEGRLRRRADFGNSYDKFWPFYDCLTMHSTSRCKYCLGRPDYATCRETFTCVENFPVELCSEAVSTSLEAVDQEVKSFEKELSAGGAAEDTAKLLARKEKFRAALETVRAEARITRLEEFTLRVEHLNLPENARAEAKAIGAEVTNLEVEILGTRLDGPIRRIDSLSDADRKELAEVNARSESIAASVKTLRQSQDAIMPLVEVSSALHRIATWTDELDKKLAGVEVSKVPGLEKWTVDPAAADGEKIIDALSELGRLLTVGLPTAETPAVDSDTNSSDKPAPKPPLSGDLQRITGLLQAIRDRVESVGRKVDTVQVGERPEFEKWAGRNDVTVATTGSARGVGGRVPEALRLSDVFSHLSRIEDLLKTHTPAEDALPLKTRAADINRQLAQAQKELDQLAGRSGLAEFRLVRDYRALQSLLNRPAAEADRAEIAARWQALMTDFVSREFYPARLADHPAILKKILAVLSDKRMDAIESRVAALEAAWPRPMWVLLDREKPSDNPWILLVYIIVPIMFLVNARRLWQFIAVRRRTGTP